MEYLLLIHNAADAAESSDEDRQAMFAAFGKYTQRLREAGAFLGGDPLQPPHTATTVRSSGGETLTTDGPYAETKEVLGGYYKIQADSLDEAIEWASQIPSLSRGDAVEVRPVVPVPAGQPG
jgi:hypothetical protein